MAVVKKHEEVFFMIYLKSIALAFLFIFLTNCGGGGASNNLQQNPLDRDYDQRIIDDENRTSILEESKKRYSGGSCEEEDDRGHECVEQCRDIYNRRADREDCEELPIAQIQVLSELHELLEDPDDDELRNIDLEDLEVYLNVSIAGFDSHIGRYSRNESKEVLFWIAENEDISNLFSDEDDEFKALEALFKEVVDGSFSPGSDTHLPFIERVDGNNRLIEIVIDAGNESALEWFHSYITETATDCSGNSDEVSLECFKVFCRIGKGIDPDFRENWLSFEDFEEYIDDIIQAEINGASYGSIDTTFWDTDDFDDAGNVTDFYTELCEDLVE